MTILSSSFRSLGWIFFFFLFLSMFLNVTVFAKLSHLQWQKLTTPHFEILFDKEQKGIALEYAIEAEVVHEILSSYFSEFPLSKTLLHIDSETDVENAWATMVPDYFMSVTPRWPSSLTFHYDSWKYSILMHEYTHVLQMSPKGSWLWRSLRLLLGNMSYPNIYLPGWYHEGMAVEIESYFSKLGRLNSPFFYGNIRAMVDEGAWGKENISSINEKSIPTWPFGNRRYFYGSILMNEIANEEIGSIDKLNIEQASHGSRLALNKAPKRLFGKTYETMLQTAYDRWQLQSEKDLKILENSPIKESQTLPLFNTSENIIERHSPQISPDGYRLIFIQVSLEQGPQIILLTRQNLNESFLPSKGKIVAFGERIQSLNWVNDEEFVFDRLKNTKRGSVNRSYNDLYRGHISGRRPQRITTAERLQFPSLSWDQTHILAIQSRGDQNFLVQVHPKTKNITVLYTPADPSRLSYPLAFTEDEIAFIKQDAYGKRRLTLWNKKTKQIKSLQLDQEDILVLSKVKGGLLYNSAASGVPNLYFWDERNQNSYPITHSKTAIRSGTFDHFHQELWISQFHADGYRIEVQKSSLESTNLPYINLPHSSKKKPLKSVSEALEPSLCSSYDLFAFDSEPLMCLPISEESLLSASTKSRDIEYVEQLRKKWQAHFQNSPPAITKYRGISYLTPYFLFPYYYYWTRGSVFGFLTRGTDVLEHHKYSLHLNYKYRLKALNGSFRYDHYKLWSFEIEDDARYIEPFRGTDKENKDFQRDTSVSLQKGFFLNDYWTTFLGWRLSRTFYSTDPKASYQYGPELTLEYSGHQSDSLFATSEDFYIRRFFDINQPSSSQTSLGIHLIWSFASPFKFLTRNKQPRFQNSSFKYHELSLKTDHIFSSYSFQISNPSLFTFGEQPPPYIRGYPESAFGGRQVHSLNLEYTFPLFEIQKGLGKGLLFFKRVDITLLSDHLILKGNYFDTQNNLQPTNMDRLFSSIGIETKLNMALGYSNVHFVLGGGLYYGLDRNVSEGLQFAFSIGSQFDF